MPDDPKRQRWNRKASLRREGFQVDGGEHFRLYVRFTTRSGRIVDFAVVLVVFHNGEEIQVARYDNAHGFTHLDILDTQGNVDRKESHDHIPIEHAIRHALDDFKKNWQAYAAHCFGHKASKARPPIRRSSGKRGGPRKTDAP